MTTACAVRVAANGIGGRRPIVAILVTAGGTLMLMQVMTKVLTGFTCLMPAISTGHTPGELECQCNDEQLKEAFDHEAIITCFVKNECVNTSRQQCQMLRARLSTAREASLTAS